ncbi:MAG: MFS transporter [Actinomycetota bacterium]|nr:MFS transporter [Actinomycetota bacterium]
MTVEEVGAVRPKTVALLAAVATVAVALNLRPAVVAVSPLLGTIREETGLSAPLAGLLTTLPLLCFGFFSPVAPRLARRIGLEWAVGASLVLLVVGILLRVFTPMSALYAGSFIAGAGIAIANVLMPAFVKREFSRHPSGILGVYTAALNLGAAAAAGLTVPVGTALALAWRPALAFWVVLAGLGFALWLPILLRSRRIQAARPDLTEAEKELAAAEDIRGFVLLRSPVARHVTGYLALQSFQFYSYAAWLPTLLGDEGIDANTAGYMLMVSNLTGAAGAVILPVFITRLRTQRRPVVAVTAFYGVSLVGLLLAPSAGAWVWVCIYGVAQGAGFSLALTLMVLRSPDTAVAARLSGVAQLVGYLVAASGPVLLGGIHDLTGGWEWPLGVLIALVVPMLWVGLGAGRDILLGSEADGRRKGGRRSRAEALGSR